MLVVISVSCCHCYSLLSSGVVVVGVQCWLVQLAIATSYVVLLTSTVGFLPASNTVIVAIGCYALLLLVALSIVG